jgi:Fic family protein
MNTRAGTYRTNFSGEAAYQSFVPSPLPPNPPIALTEDFVTLLVSANKQLSVLDALAARLPSVNLFISMYVRKEALMSSQIEGTQATLEDILNPQVTGNANRDVTDVVNYVKATEYAIKRLNTLPLCNKLLKETHAILMEGVRGQEKTPGQFRHSQNWIGATGSTLKNARYVPPTPEDMMDALGELEKYYNDSDGTDELIRAALIHYQFETIHPFLDGNGRIGRLLITLYLHHRGVLKTPALYISYFLKKNRVEYYDRMTAVRQNGNYEQWVKFFVEAIKECSEDATQNIDKLVALHNSNIDKISAFSQGKAATLKLFDYLEQNPIVEIATTAAALGVAYNTMTASIARLCDAGILVQTSTVNRKRTFCYQAYLDILREGTESV